MRVLTFTTLFPNSLAPNFAPFLLQRISHLAKRPGNVVEVVAPLPYAPQFLRKTGKGYVAGVPASELIGGVRVHHPRYLLLPGVSMPAHGLLMYAGSLTLLRKLHRRLPFDCIDAHYVFPDGLAAVLLGKSLGIPVTLTARGSDIHTFPNFSTIRPQICWTLRQAAGVAAVSASLAQIMSDLEPSIATPTVIGNGVDTQRFCMEDRLLARKNLGIAEDARVVVSVAALKQVKGCDLLVRAASLLKRSTPRCQVLFVGNGPDLPALRRLATELDCADVCVFLGAIPNGELGLYYNAADVSCLPSRNEGWPNVILESLACGTPVVGTRVGGVPEILNRSEIGIVVEPSPEAIHQGLVDAFHRQWNRERIAAHTKSYTWDKVAEQADDFLRGVIGKKTPALQCAVTT